MNERGELKHENKLSFGGEGASGMRTWIRIGSNGMHFPAQSCAESILMSFVVFVSEIVMNNLNNLLDDDDDYVQQLQARRRAELMQAQLVSQNSLRLEELAGVAVERALTKTSLQYAVIGGKAAAGILQQVSKTISNNNRALAYSTSDWDIMVTPSSFEALAAEVTQAATNATGIQMTQHDFQDPTSGKLIYLFGYLHARVFTSLMDFHISKTLPPVITIGGVKYASTSWIIQELNRTIRNHSSASEALKYLKRQKRLQLLRQLTPDRVQLQLGAY